MAGCSQYERPDGVDLHLLERRAGVVDIHDDNVPLGLQESNRQDGSVTVVENLTVVADDDDAAAITVAEPELQDAFDSTDASIVASAAAEAEHGGSGLSGMPASRAGGHGRYKGSHFEMEVRPKRSKSRFRRLATSIIVVAVIACAAYFLLTPFGVRRSQMESPDSIYEAAAAYYEDGNYAKAMELYLKAVDAGNSSSMNRIGYMYDEGRGVAQDYGEALEWYRKAADAGSFFAMNNIGYMYEHGRGVEQDHMEAMLWYRKAADGGLAVAMNNIGYMFHFGEGVKQNYGKAMEWYRKAADSGNSGAMSNIGYMYRRGEGVEQDYAKAAEWYRKAADAGSALAKDVLEKMNY